MFELIEKWATRDIGAVQWKPNAAVVSLPIPRGLTRRRVFCGVRPAYLSAASDQWWSLAELRFSLNGAPVGTDIIQSSNYQEYGNPAVPQAATFESGEALRFDHSSTVAAALRVAPFPLQNYDVEADRVELFVFLAVSPANTNTFHYGVRVQSDEP